MSATSPTSVCPAARSPAIAGLAELTLETDDPERVARFYMDLLGLELISRQADRVWLALGHDTPLGLWAPGPKEFGDRGGSHVHFAFAASRDRLSELAERIRGAGIEVRGPVEHPGGDRSIYFRDAAGNLVEAWDYRRPFPSRRCSRSAGRSRTSAPQGRLAPSCWRPFSASASIGRRSHAGSSWRARRSERS